MLAPLPCPSPHLLSDVTWAATRRIYHLEAKGSENGSDGAARESQDEELEHNTEQGVVELVAWVQRREQRLGPARPSS